MRIISTHTCIHLYACTSLSDTVPVTHMPTNSSLVLTHTPPCTPFSDFCLFFAVYSSSPQSDETKYTILGILKSHFLFRQLQEYELEDVIDAMQEAYVEEGEDIITEGEEGDKFFVLEEGEAEIIINGAVVAPMKEGCFGDLALMYNSPRSATIRALSECHMWTLDRVFFASRNQGRA